MGLAQTRVFENDDLFYELIRPVLPNAADVEAQFSAGLDDDPRRLLDGAGEI